MKTFDDRMTLCNNDELGDVFVYTGSNDLWFNYNDISAIFDFYDVFKRTKINGVNEYNKTTLKFTRQDGRKYEEIFINTNTLIELITDNVNSFMERQNKAEDFIYMIIQDFDKYNTNESDNAFKFACKMEQGINRDDRSMKWLGRIAKHDSVKDLLGPTDYGFYDKYEEIEKKNKQLEEDIKLLRQMFEVEEDFNFNFDNNDGM